MRTLGARMYQSMRHGVAAGTRVYHQARHVGRQLDRHVQFAARLYATAIQPGLRAAGVDTRGADRTLKAAHDHYGMLKEQTQAGIRVADGVAAHVRAGYAYA